MASARAKLRVFLALGALGDEGIDVGVGEGQGGKQVRGGLVEAAFVLRPRRGRRG